MIIYVFYDTLTSTDLQAFAFDEMLADRYWARHPNYELRTKNLPEYQVGPFMYLYGTRQIHKDYVTNEDGTYFISMDAKESDQLSHACELLDNEIQSQKKKLSQFPFLGSYKRALDYLLNEKYDFNTDRLELDIRKDCINDLIKL